MPIGYAAVEKFGPEHSSWKKFLDFSQIVQAEEIVGLDTILCSNAFNQPATEDWDHLIDPEHMGIFDNFEFLLKKLRHPHSLQLLAVWMNPSEQDIGNFPDRRFEFLGFDLIESAPASTGISALTNCGGAFDKVFRVEELSKKGLITEFHRATQIQRDLKEKYPDEDHAQCDIWAIWRAVPGSQQSLW